MMKIKKTFYFWVVLLAVISGGCSHLEGSEIDAPAVSNSESASLDGKLCRTYGFRNWSIQRGDGTTTLSAEASMPNPAWSVVLHEGVRVNNDSIELTLETIEPTGLSSSVITWIYFEETINTITSPAAYITVKCAGEMVWTSQKG